MSWVSAQAAWFGTQSRRAELLGRAIGLFGLALVPATWTLWTPQRIFPQVPLVRQLGELPDWSHVAGALALVAGLCLALAAPAGSRAARIGLIGYAVSAAGMALLDQARLQPWAYLFLLIALVLAWAEPHRALPLARILIISFYAYSGATKLDYTFLHTLGQQFLVTLAGLVGIATQDWTESTRVALATGFPAGELLVALGLCFARSRKLAVAAAVTMHLVLLAILGPWGLDHKPAVLIWNLYFIVQDVLLFWPLRAKAEPSAVELPRSARPAPGCWWAAAVVGAAAVLPGLGTSTWWDVWPSWGLYAPAAERVQMFVHRRELSLLPDELRRHAAPQPAGDEPWHLLRLDRWALEATGAAIYPQNRFQLGVAEAVVVRFGLVHRVRVVRLGLADRWDGSRKTELVSSLAALQAAGDDYFFNSRPSQARFAPPAQVEANEIVDGE